MSCPLRHILLLILVTLLAAYGLWSCSPSAERIRLEAADAIMEQNPDSAYAIVCSTDTSALRSADDRALYALLYTQARTKLNYVQTDDSLIATAVRYYERRGDSPELMRALFYRGDVTYNDGDMHTALLSTIRARAIAIDQGDHYWRAKCAEQLADIYSSAYNNGKAITYTEEACREYLQAGKIRNNLFSSCDLGTRIFNIGDTVRGVALLDSVLTVAREDKDSVLMGYSLKSLIVVNTTPSTYSKAQSYWEEMLRLSHIYPITPYLYASRAEMAIYKGDYNVADELLGYASGMSCNKKDSLTINLCRVFLNARLSDYKSAYDGARQIIVRQDADFDYITERSLESGLSDYYKTLADRGETESRLLLWIEILTVIIFIIIVICSVVFFRYKLNKKDSELDRAAKELYSLSQRYDNAVNDKSTLIETLATQTQRIATLASEVEHQQSEIAKADDTNNKVIASLFKDRWSLINTLCYEYFEKKGLKNLNAGVVDGLKEQIDMLRSRKSLDMICEIVNLCKDDIIKRLQKQCPSIKESDVAFLTYIYAGFSPRSVCLFMDITLPNYYKKRQRIIRRILSSEAIDKDWFVNCLESAK